MQKTGGLNASQFLVKLQQEVSVILSKGVLNSSKNPTATPSKMEKLLPYTALKYLNTLKCVSLLIAVFRR